MQSLRLVMIPGLALTAGLAATPAVHAAISIDDASAVYSQNFNSLGVNSSSSASQIPWINDSTLMGWSLFNSLGQTPTTYRAEIGNQDIGSFSSYGLGNSSERALGGIAAGNAYFGSPAVGAVAGWIAVAFLNNTGGALDSITLTYAGEQWRFSSAPAQTMALEIGTGRSFASVANWMAPGAGFDFRSPRFGNVGLGGINGSTDGRVSGLGGTQAVQWGAGETLWMRWSLVNSAGSRHGLAIDDLALSVTAAPPVPEPGTWALMLGGVVALGALRRRRGSSI